MAWWALGNYDEHFSSVLSSKQLIKHIISRLVNNDNIH